MQQLATNLRRLAALALIGSVILLLAVVGTGLWATSPVPQQSDVRVDCGALSDQAPNYQPVRDAKLVEVLRIDRKRVYEKGVWCIAGLRVYDRGAEIVGYLAGELDAINLPWGSTAAGMRVEEMTVVVDTPNGKLSFIGSWNYRPGGVLSVSLVDQSRTSWATAFAGASKVELVGAAKKVVEGPWAFPPLRVANGEVDERVEHAGLALRLRDLRSDRARFGVAYLDLNESFPAPFLQRMDWAPLRDDQGREYAYRGTAILTDEGGAPLPFLYARFDPVAPDAKTVEISVLRGYAILSDGWILALPIGQ